MRMCYQSILSVRTHPTCHGEEQLWLSLASPSVHALPFRTPLQSLRNHWGLLPAAILGLKGTDMRESLAGSLFPDLA